MLQSWNLCLLNYHSCFFLLFISVEWLRGYGVHKWHKQTGYVSQHWFSGFSHWLNTYWRRTSWSSQELKYFITMATEKLTQNYKNDLIFCPPSTNLVNQAQKNSVRHTKIKRESLGYLYLHAAISSCSKINTQHRKKLQEGT